MTPAKAFAAAAAVDGLALHPATFDWLSEQGHVGLERVAKARRDPAIVAPAQAAIAALAAIYARLRGDITVLARVAREPAAAGRAVPRADRHRCPGGRRRALHLVPADGARPVPGGRRRSGSTSTSTGRCAASWPRAPTACSAGLPAKGFGFGGVQRERAYHDALLDLATPAMGHPPADPDRGGGRRRCGGLRAQPRRCSRRSAPERRVDRLVGDRDVDGLAARALHAHLLRHVAAVHRRGEHGCRTGRRRSRRGRCR